jgi:hemerythrin-like domain-containing protein
MWTRLSNLEERKGKMTPIEVLMHEHEIILMVLGKAEQEAQRMQESGQVNAEKAEQMVDFIRNFADRCHHAKEEDLLFVRMRERGMPVEGGPIGVMLMEHVEGRRLVKAVAEALPDAAKGDAQAVAAVRDNLRGYVRLLRAHIGKEDNVLYPMADRMLTAEDQQWLANEFDRVEAEEMGSGVHEKYHEMAHSL